MADRVTIADIAVAAGVSRQTVTRAMNGMPRISEETRARVLEVSARLGYRPSRFAANLSRTDKAKTIGFVVDSFRNPYYSELTASLLDAARLKGWQVSVWSHENEQELELLSRIAAEVDVVTGYFGDVDEGDLISAARGVPVVLLENAPVSSQIRAIEFDFESALRDMVARLRTSGSRRFAMLESPTPGRRYAPTARRQAYERVMDADSAQAVTVCSVSTHSAQAGESGIRELLQDFPDTDTVIAFSDLVAMGVLHATWHMGRDVPGSLRVVGIDGLSLGAALTPALTSLALLGDELTEAFVDVVESALNDEPATNGRRVVTPRPIWRESA